MSNRDRAEILDPRSHGTYFLGRYRVVDEIGVGGMASVHLARMDGPGGFQKWIAIKRIHGHLIEDESFVQMFLDEARVAARISHPNVATVFELGKHDDSYWIAMEYLHGEPLREIMRRTEELGQTMPPEIACKVIADAAEGLHAAHELSGNAGEKLGLVHRDVTPHNLFVTYDGVTKVVDFGIAKFSSRMSSSTRAGTLKGKLAYMSPEQVHGETIDRRTDIFALGVVLWELTTGQRLFRMDNDLDTLAKVQECNVPRPSSIVRGYPMDLEKIVLKALVKNRGERYRTAREFSRALQSFFLRRGLFIASDEVSAYMHGIFQERMGKRDAHLRWAAEITQSDEGPPPQNHHPPAAGSGINYNAEPPPPGGVRPAAGAPARNGPPGSGPGGPPMSAPPPRPMQGNPPSARPMQPSIPAGLPPARPMQPSVPPGAMQAPPVPSTRPMQPSVSGAGPMQSGRPISAPRPSQPAPSYPGAQSSSPAVGPGPQRPRVPTQFGLGAVRPPSPSAVIVPEDSHPADGDGPTVQADSPSSSEPATLIGRAHSPSHAPSFGPPPARPAARSAVSALEGAIPPPEDDEDNEDHTIVESTHSFMEASGGGGPPRGDLAFNDDNDDPVTRASFGAPVVPVGVDRPTAPPPFNATLRVDDLAQMPNLPAELRQHAQTYAQAGPGGHQGQGQSYDTQPPPQQQQQQGYDPQHQHQQQQGYDPQQHPQQQGYDPQQQQQQYSPQLQGAPAFAQPGYNGNPNDVGQQTQQAPPRHYAPTAPRMQADMRTVTVQGAGRPKRTTMIVLVAGAAALLFIGLMVLLAVIFTSPTEVPKTASTAKPSAGAPKTPPASSTGGAVAATPGAGPFSSTRAAFQGVLAAATAVPEPPPPMPAPTVIDIAPAPDPAPSVAPTATAAPAASTAQPAAQPAAPPTPQPTPQPVATIKPRDMAAPTAAPASGTASLSVICLPGCSQVYDNGALLGASPVFNRSVPSGRHTLRLVSDSGTKSMTISLRPDEKQSLRVPMGQ